MENERQQMFREGEPRYLTKGIDEKFPAVYQILLWNTIDTLRDSGQELDYLQVFDIKTTDKTDGSGKILTITHSQEVPPYTKEYDIPIKNDEPSVSGKIYVIDDITHATMLWAYEY